MAFDILFGGKVKIRTHGIRKPCTGCRGGHGRGNGLKDLCQVILGAGREEIICSAGNTFQNRFSHVNSQFAVGAHSKADGIDIHAQALEAGNVLLSVQLQAGACGIVVTNGAVIRIITPYLVILKGILVDNGIELRGIALNGLCPPVLSFSIVEIIIRAECLIVTKTIHRSLHFLNQISDEGTRRIRCIRCHTQCIPVHFSKSGIQIPVTFNANGLHGREELLRIGHNLRIKLLPCGKLVETIC